MKLWPAKKEKKDSLRCSFCNLSQRDVKLLISGPGIYICDQCIDICNTVITEYRTKQCAPPDTEKS